MKRVLIVDDATFMRISIRTMLEKNGFQVVGEAENGEVAVKKYVELNPDIVTMDITMPDMDGVQALKAIKQIDNNCKIVMVSAMGQETFVREAVMSGAKGFIVKPVNEEHLVKTLSKL
ncbi:two-component system chemotaxis response regulator CheY [Clostridium punense]|uniref:Stage 0 sporulation protein A homolog n=1 Tax=Clostridium punense TaxID=1054297 RepID=A0ABS4K1X1_9CLOT|nr:MULTISPECIES: response regulator [Clostridium]EQB86943.1 chemotaxis protein CheY [Clostridium sp. BL8]MBP2021240.1 two-component system chemotaxis response regulator CheY [Clostridium punense]